jgi:hypothetical protein
LIRRPKKTESIERNRHSPKRSRRPFWLPASGFYVLAAAAAIFVFFLIWSILHDGSDEKPWATAGISASIVLAGAVLLREVVLRGARNRLLETQRQLDRSLKATQPVRSGMNHDGNKLTLEKNAAILQEIKQKSDAAKVLGKMPAGHKEVFDMCDRYISVTGDELKNIGAGSPRLAPLLRGREMVEEFHKFHLLQWAEIETRSLMQEARHLQKFNEKLALAQKAVVIVDSALDHYPNDENLKESSKALKEFVASIKISNWVERAEKAAFKGNYKQAKKLYNDALFFVQREVNGDDNRQIAAAKITDGLTKINGLEDATE